MRRFAMMLACGLVVGPSTLTAQVCLGWPAQRTQSDIGAAVRVRSKLSELGATYSTHLPSDIVADGMAVLDHFSSGSVSANGATIGGRIGLALHSPSALSALSLCPHTGLSLRRLSGVNITQIPIGFGVGTSMALGGGGTASEAVPGRRTLSAAGNALLIFAVPAVYWERASARGGSGSKTSLGTELGARLVFSKVFAGASVLVRSNDYDTVLSLNAGIPLGAH